MLLVTCPICSICADETAFTCGGDAHVTRPQSTNPTSVSADELGDYLNFLPNAPGWSRENWLCHGCESWFVMLRHSLTNHIHATYQVGDTPPLLPEADA